MADTVQYYLEQMVPELEDLENKGIFSKAEVKSIVKRRTKFEYALKRRISKKIDYLRYVEYEMNLEALRKKRKSRLDIKSKTSISDYAGVRRINFIFERALRKFGGDVSLWLQYIDFAKSSGASKTLGKLFAKAIQLHPSKTSLWILAASWEFEENANIVAARTLMQRGLRLNPEKEQLWHEYFRLELAYVEKIKKTANELSEDITSALKNEQNPILSGALAKIVYKNAIDANPNSLSFREKFVDIYRQFSDTEEGQNEIFASIERDFPEDPRARAFLAARHVNVPTLDTESPLLIPEIRKSIEEFNKSLKEIPTSEMCLLYIQFLSQWYSKVSEPNLRLYLSKSISSVFKSAQKQGYASQEVYSAVVQQYLREDDINNARITATRGTEAHPEEPTLWLTLISITDDSALDLYSKALTHNPSSFAIWSSYFDWIFLLSRNNQLGVPDIEKYFTNAVSDLNRLYTKCKIAAEVTSIKELVFNRYAEWAVEKGGIQKGREVYEKLIKNTPPLSFFQHCVKLELDSECNGQHPTPSLNKFVKDRVEWIYDMALRAKEDSEDIWLEYINFLNSTQQVQKSLELYWRAINLVADRDSFEKRYRAILDKQDVSSEANTTLEREESVTFDSQVDDMMKIS
ncbi:uncharacterized protein VTP21DRAFT_993 [Calcarisporiella thermophila]|uniref:uncharacterized protein n=1 Tax=Calcarisporiella thermophila TaxID=911321 RepID=UPI003741EC63